MPLQAFLTCSSPTITSTPPGFRRSPHRRRNSNRRGPHRRRSRNFRPRRSVLPGQSRCFRRRVPRFSSFRGTLVSPFYENTPIL